MRLDQFKQLSTAMTKKIKMKKSELSKFEETIITKNKIISFIFFFFGLKKK